MPKRFPAHQVRSRDRWCRRHCSDIRRPEYWRDHHDQCFAPDNCAHHHRTSQYNGQFDRPTDIVAASRLHWCACWSMLPQPYWWFSAARSDLKSVDRNNSLNTLSLWGCLAVAGTMFSKPIYLVSNLPAILNIPGTYSSTTHCVSLNPTCPLLVLLYTANVTDIVLWQVCTLYPDDT